MSDDNLVPWAVWAALSELIVCWSGSQLGTAHRRTEPVVTSASVWQRAEEIRCYASAEAIGQFSSCNSNRFCTSRTDSRNQELRVRCPESRSKSLDKFYVGVGGSFTNDEVAPTPGQHHCQQGRIISRVTGSCSTGDIGKCSTAGFGGRGSGTRGYGDISYSADEYASTELGHHRGRSVLSTGFHRSSRRSSLPTSASLNAVRERPSSAPQAADADKRRLHQTLSTSRRSWLPHSKQQRSQPGRRQRNGRTWSPPGSPLRLGVSASRATATQPSRRGQLDQRQGSGPLGGDERIANLDRRPVTAPGAPEASGMKGRITKTPSTPDICPRSTPKTAPMRHSCGGVMTRDQWNTPMLGGQSTPMLGGQSWAGEWDAAPVTDEGGCKLTRRDEAAARDETAHEMLLRELENGHFRTETESAKRKASKYQACMLEAQVDHPNPPVSAVDHLHNGSPCFRRPTVKEQFTLLQKSFKRASTAGREWCFAPRILSFVNSKPPVLSLVMRVGVRFYVVPNSCTALNTVSLVTELLQNLPLFAKDIFQPQCFPHSCCVAAIDTVLEVCELTRRRLRLFDRWLLTKSNNECVSSKDELWKLRDCCCSETGLGSGGRPELGMVSVLGEVSIGGDLRPTGNSSKTCRGKRHGIPGRLESILGD